ncbi:MAG: type II secretion system F family protein [Planctomycetes bacterium]|nr:type II secretion system F family protein [Planctomycetota bacterium]
MLLWFNSLLLAGAVFLITWTFIRVHTEVMEQKREDDEVMESALLKLFLPYIRTIGYFILAFSKACERREGRGREGEVGFFESLFLMVLRGYLAMRTKTEQTIVAAGRPFQLTADEAYGFSVLGGILGLLFGLMDYFVVKNRAFVAGMGLIGAVLPLMWLGDQARQRQDAMRKILPVTIDLLTLAVEAGLDFTAAIAMVIDKQKGNPLAKELSEMLREVRMGKPRREALRDLDRRCALDELSPVASALIQADQMGSDLGPVLRIHSDQLRVKRFQNIEKKSNEAPVKMLFPLLFFIFPTVFIVIFGPIYLYFFQ